MTQFFLIFAALAGMSSVMLGAFAAHSLKHALSIELLDAFQTATQYQMYHALGLLFIATAMKQKLNNRWLIASGYFFVSGIILFCGSLYGLTLTGLMLFGPITPLGGICFILGWASLIIAVSNKYND